MASGHSLYLCLPVSIYIDLLVKYVGLLVSMCINRYWIIKYVTSKCSSQDAISVKGVHVPFTLTHDVNKARTYEYRDKYT